jgi:hypothetical protein
MTIYSLANCKGVTKMSYLLRARIALERKIAKTIVEDALRAGYALNVQNGGETDELPNPSTDSQLILKTMFQTDDEYLMVYDLTNGKHVGWVRFVYGNSGWDVVNDYTVNLEPILARANAISDKAEA